MPPAARAPADRPLRIALLMASAGSRLGGLETITREFAAGLAARGHAVTLVTGAGPGARTLPELRSAPLPYRLLTAPMLGQTSLPARLLGRRRGIHPAIVESKTFWAATRHTPALMRRLQGSSVVAAFYEVEAVEASRDLRAPLVYYYAGPIDPRRLARGRFTRIVAISRMVADYHAGLDPHLALPPVDGVVHPGVAEAQIADGPAPGVTAAAPELLFTGRLDSTGEKRAGKLLEWWPQIAAAVPAARLTLAGGGTDLARLRQIAAAGEYGGAVTLPGPWPHDTLFAHLRQAGLYACPSRLETFGVAPLEALAAGLPVVASDIPGLRESLGEAALLLPVEDDAAWIATLIGLLADPALRLAWAARGPTHARQFTWARQTAALEAELRTAVAAHSPGGAARTARPRPPRV